MAKRQIWGGERRSFTSLKPGAESFQIITVPWEEDVHVFCREAKACAEAQTAFIQQEKETDRLIYFSCTPWFDFTALTNEHNFDKDDTIPRIAWGKSIIASFPQSKYPYNADEGFRRYCS